MKVASHTPVTAAIGDGANDVSMIQEAHVGLGMDCIFLSLCYMFIIFGGKIDYDYGKRF